VIGPGDDGKPKLIGNVEDDPELDDDVDWGEWEETPEGPYWISCCDCHLCHRIATRVRRGRVELAFARDEEATTAARAGEIDFEDSE
jgi:Zn-finger protein